MPSEELKKNKTQIAIVTAAINEAEVANSGARVILPLRSDLKALRRQAEKLEAGEIMHTTDPEPGSGLIEVSIVSETLWWQHWLKKENKPRINKKARKLDRRRKRNFIPPHSPITTNYYAIPHGNVAVFGTQTPPYAAVNPQPHNIHPNA